MKKKLLATASLMIALRHKAAFKLASAMLGAFLFLCMGGLSAQTRLLTENFDYPQGDIAGNGSWLRDGTGGGTNILSVSNGALTYSGYQELPIGRVLSTRIISGQKALVSFPAQTTASVYYSILLCVDSVKGSSADYFLAFSTGEENSRQFGKLYVKGVAEKNIFSIGVVRSGMTNYGGADFKWGDTLLVVVKYEFVDGPSNDKVSVWVNPNKSAETASAPYIQNKPEETGDDITSIGAIQVRQSTTTPLTRMDALRVATSWQALFAEQPPVPTKPTITLNSSSVDFGLGYDDLVYSKTLVVKGERLTGDISAALVHAKVITMNKKVISKEKAMSPEGESIIIQLNASHQNFNADTVIFTTTNADTLKLPLAWQTYGVTEMKNLKELRSQVEKDPDNYMNKIYKIQNKVLVSCVYPVKSGNTVYQMFVQDSLAGITINDPEGIISETYQSGDELNHLFGNLKLSFGSLSFTPVRDFPLPLSSGNEVLAVCASLAQIKANPKEYESRLIALTQVEFPNRKNENGGFFKEGINPKMMQAATTIEEGFMLRVLKGFDFIGDTIPAKADIIGVSTAGTGKLIAPRFKKDIRALNSTPEPIDTLPQIRLNPVNLPTFAAKVDSTVSSVEIKVEGLNLTQEVQIKITGDNANYFTSSVASIPTKNGQTMGSFSIAYQPKVAGRHFANIELSSLGASTQRIEVVGVATANISGNKPNIVLSKDSLMHFTAEVGSKMVDSILLNATDLKDYLHVKLSGEQKGNFLISTSMFGKTVVDAKFKVTYQPKGEGSHTAYVLFFSKEADTVVLVIHGTAIKNGDTTVAPDFHTHFVLDTTNPKTKWVQDFSSVLHNQKIEDSIMQNVVLQWNRPWWGYSFKNEAGERIESAAKATGYVYQQDTTGNCEMWLVTPALDFKNAKEKIFTFRVRGDFMFEHHSSKIELYYMEKVGDSVYKSIVPMPMPSIPDENKTWREFHLDLKDQNIADIFFMGFRFYGPTGSNSSVVYYIDDVSFGREDLGSITSTTDSLSLRTEVYTQVESAEIVVKAKNLKQQISISVLGPNAGKFVASKEFLEASGGSFKVTFSPMEEGLHLAYIKLSSAGCPDVIIPMEGRGVKSIAQILIASKDTSIHLNLIKGSELTSQKIVVNSFLLTENISLSIEGADATNFRLSKTSIDKNAVADGFTVTYAPIHGNIHFAKVRLHSQGVSDVLISLYGTKTTAIETLEENPFCVLRTNFGFHIENNGIYYKKIEVYNLSGQKVYLKNSGNSSLDVPVKNRGIYFVKITTEKGARLVKTVW
ncbi:MAG: choice-of-anchor J domain-containing protein [Bacteroidales bacterium]